MDNSSALALSQNTLQIMFVDVQNRFKNSIYVFPAAILDFRLKEASEKVGIGTIEKCAPENMEVAAGIYFLSRSRKKLLLLPV